MKKLHSILLVDNNKVTSYVNHLLLMELNVAGELVVMLNSSKAIAYVREAFENPTVPLPDLILLDLIMPVMDGFEWLEEYAHMPVSIRKKPPVAILTTSTRKKDQNKAKRYREVIAYLNKPLTREKLENLLKKL